MSEEIRIRIAAEEDAEELVKIYEPYVLKTAITFEYEVPTAEEFRSRIRQTLERYPYLVAERNGTLLGYAYAGTFNKRAACDWTAETSIYVEEHQKHSGVGGKLNYALEEILKEMGITNLEACIAVPEIEDEYLTRNSIDYHTHIGYRLVGEFEKCGCKFGRWYDLVWMEKIIGEHKMDPAHPVWFPDLQKKF